jgi:REP element-mobilizing transposase RayT
MSQPLVIAYHLIWTGYGWWLPNDPRGSGSRTVRSDVLAQLGELHFGRKRVQPAGREVRAFYAEAAPLLRHPLVSFDENARSEIASAFADVLTRERYTCYACAILPDHVHILLRKHRHQAEDMITHLKDASRARLAGSLPGDHPVWSDGLGWKVFLDHPDEVRRTIVYVRKNPLPLGLPIQEWAFVTPYDGWPLHPGHSVNSPYVRALREAGRYPNNR